MKRIILITICFLMSLMIVACSQSNSSENITEEQSQEQGEQSQEQILSEAIEFDENLYDEIIEQADENYLKAKEDYADRWYKFKAYYNDFFNENVEMGLTNTGLGKQFYVLMDDKDKAKLEHDKQYSICAKLTDVTSWPHIYFEDGFFIDEQ